MIYRFGEFELDVAVFELRRSGVPIPLEPRVMDLLGHLVRHRDRVVSRRELRETVWQGVFIGDDAITRAVQKLRRALGEPADGESTITTVRGRGYRFVASATDAPLTPEPSGGDAREAVFVGRDDVLDALQCRYARARASDGGIALLCGEPGIGKTRTVEEFARAAEAKGARVVFGRGHEADGAPAFWPWRSVLAALLPAHAASGHRHGRASRPRLSSLLDAPAGASTGERSRLLSAEERFFVFDAMATLIREAADTQPLVIALDDLHWMDEPSLLVFTFLIRELRRSRVLMVGTYRLPAVIGPMARALGAVERIEPGATILLHGLGHEAIAAFVNSTCGHAPSSATVDQLAEHTGGNPLFLLQLSYSGFAGDLPRGVLPAIERHLDVLSESCRTLLTVASVFGRTFSLPLLAATARLGAKHVLDRLDEALAARVILADVGGLGTFRFAHALIRDTLYASHSSSQRATLHAAAADSMVAQYAGRLDPHLATLAHHYSLSAAIGYGEQAVTYAAGAAEAASAAFAYETAVQLYEQALCSLDLAPDRRRRLDLLLGLGSAHARAADYARSRAAFEEAAGLAESLGLADAMGRSAFGAALEAESGTPDVARIRLLERALAVLGDAETPTVALCMARLAAAIWAEDALDRRLALSLRAVAIARMTEDREALAYTLRQRHWLLLVCPDRIVERAELSEEMMRLASSARTSEAEALAGAARVEHTAAVGDRAGLETAIAEFERTGEALRQPNTRWCTVVYRGMLALVDGRLSDAEASLERATAFGERAANDVRRNWLGAQLFLMRREQGRLAELESAVRGRVDACPDLTSWRAALAYLLLEQGRREEARELLLSRIRQTVNVRRSMDHLITVELFGEVAARLHDASAAGPLYEALLPWDGQQVIIGPAVALNGCASRTLGRLASTLGRKQAAESHFMRAIAADTAFGARPAAAYAHLAYAEALLASKTPVDRWRAIPHITAAGELAFSVGMPALLAKLTALESLPSSARRAASHGART